MNNYYSEPLYSQGYIALLVFVIYNAFRDVRLQE
jgi:hypothetical protein